MFYRKIITFFGSHNYITNKELMKPINTKRLDSPIGASRRKFIKTGLLSGAAALTGCTGDNNEVSAQTHNISINSVGDIDINNIKKLATDNKGRDTVNVNISNVSVTGTDFAKIIEAVGLKTQYSNIRINWTGSLYAGAEGVILSKSDWEKMGKPRLTTQNGIKFRNIDGEKPIDFAPNESAFFVKEPVTATVEIAGPNEFAAKAEEIKNFLADTENYSGVRVIIKQNIPVTDAVLNILNQKTITGDKVNWTDSTAAFVPTKANHEIDGALFANLPVGQNGEMRFWVAEDKGSRLLKDFRGLVNTNHIATSWLLTMLADEKAGLRAQERITVDTGKAGMLQDAVDARHFTGYTGKEAPIYARLQNETKQLVLKNATVAIMKSFLTSEVRAAHNFGRTNTKMDVYTGPGKLQNENFGTNGPIHVVLPVGVLNDLHSNYADVGYESVIVKKGERIDENDALVQWERSRLDMGSVNFTFEDKEIDLRWTPLDGGKSLFKSQSGTPVMFYDFRFLEWLSKDLFELKKHGVTLKVGNDLAFVFPSYLSGIFNGIVGTSWQPCPKAADYMLLDLNIVLDQKPAVQAYPLQSMVPLHGIVPPTMREIGGWVHGADWYQYWGRTA